MNGSAKNTNEDLWGLRPVRWFLRMFAHENDEIEGLNRLRCAVTHRRQVIEFLGLCVPEGGSETLVARLKSALDARRQSIIGRPDGHSILYRNLHHLGSALDLCEVELDVLALRAMATLHPAFATLADDFFDRSGEFAFRRLLANVLDVPHDAIDETLAASGNLVRTGLVGVSHCTVENLTGRLLLLPRLAPALVTPASSLDELFAMVFPPRREATLGLSAYPHLSREIALIRECLAQGTQQRAKGVNVLLHGAPGTGKTELAAAVAQALSRPLYAAPSTIDDFSPITPRERLSEIVQLQRLVNVTARGLVLVDEAEDLFPTRFSDSEKIPTKAAVNECLEQNPTPTIWISNRVGHMDEAFLRRFDLVIHVPPLPCSLRRELLRDALPAQVLDERELRHYGERRELTPAVLARMARVATTGDNHDPATVRANLRVLSGHYLRVLGADPLPMSNAQPVLEHDPALLNTDVPLDGMLDSMQNAKISARMLLHGTPGTGKTALGKVLAERLNKPLLQRQASSLLSCYLGETERNLREMFDEARREDGVLLLDEADSFLRSRGDARVRWEVTQTNELLTQMEAFEGIFICTTNRLDDLDPAALRRFDFKVEFKALRPEQRLRLVRQCSAALGLGYCVDDEAVQAHVRELEGLTPGDAAAALRRLRIAGGSPTLDALLSALIDECRYKPAVSKPIGFMH